MDSGDKNKNTEHILKKFKFHVKPNSNLRVALNETIDDFVIKMEDNYHYHRNKAFRSAKRSTSK